ncbi:MAG: hypothetical protein R6V19_10575 [Armatimonadota bacterium]
MQITVALIALVVLFSFTVTFAQGTDRSIQQKTITSCAVLPFANETSIEDEKLPDKIASAVALALEDTREFIVTSSYDLERAMDSEGFMQPLSETQMIALGKTLRVDKIMTGKITELSIDKNSGRARCSIEMRMLDVEIGDYLDGAQITVQTQPIPQWSGQVTQALNNAFRQVAETGVQEMLAARVRRGQVQAVTDTGEVNTNLGIGDGVTVGSQFLVMRARWQSDLEKTVLRRVGKVVLSDVQTNQSWGNIMQGAIPRTGDLLYRLYKPKEVVRAEVKKKSVTKVVRALAAVGLLVGIYNTGTGDTTGTESDVVGYLEQAGMGEDPTVVLKVHSSTTEQEKTEGWLIYRAANNPYFPDTPHNLIDMIQGKKLPDNGYSDDPNLPANQWYREDEEISFPYFGEEGEQEVASVTASYNHEPLQAGYAYYYAVRRIIQPLFPPGYNPPTNTEQAEEPVEPNIEWDPEEAKVLADVSKHTGPITYFTPPSLSEPDNEAPNQSVTNIRFVWQRTEGADVYRVELFAPNDPTGRLTPVWAHEKRSSSGTTESTTFDVADSSQGLDPDTTYYWRVGAKASGDPKAPNNRAIGKSGWLYSEMRSFHTVDMPPGVLGADTDAPRTERTPGFFGSVRRGSTGR